MTTMEKNFKISSKYTGLKFILTLKLLWILSQ